MLDSNKTKLLKQYIGPIVLLLVGPLFIVTTNPDNLPLPFLVLPFIWLFASLLVGTRLLLKRQTKASNAQIWYISVLVALVPVLLLVFQSIHQLSIQDILLTAGIVVIATVYMLRADFIR